MVGGDEEFVRDVDDRCSEGFGGELCSVARRDAAKRGEKGQEGGDSEWGEAISLLPREGEQREGVEGVPMSFPNCLSNCSRGTTWPGAASEGDESVAGSNGSASLEVLVGAGGVGVLRSVIWVVLVSVERRESV